jgi:linoleoyl-CoA desaturase
MKTTCNFGIKNKILTWLTGGLNFQIEHHLFPDVCSIHYPQISKMVSNTAEKYRLPYFVYPTFSAAVKSHFKMLKKLGQIPPSQN